VTFGSLRIVPLLFLVHPLPCVYGFVPANNLQSVVPIHPPIRIPDIIPNTSRDRKGRRRLIATRPIMAKLTEEEEVTAKVTNVELVDAEDAPVNEGWLLTLCLPLWLVYVSNQWSRSSI
jgi:hypothetical protein